MGFFFQNPTGDFNLYVVMLDLLHDSHVLALTGKTRHHIDGLFKTRRHDDGVLSRRYEDGFF